MTTEGTLGGAGGSASLGGNGGSTPQGFGGAVGSGGSDVGRGGSASVGGSSNSEAACGVVQSLAQGKVQMENLCRGLVAIRSGSNNFLSWRLMGYEAPDTGFNVYRNGTKVNANPVSDSTNFVDEGAPSTATYTVRAVIGGKEYGDSSTSRTTPSAASVLPQNYLTIPLKTPSGYNAGDASPGDLDGDGQYELVVKEQQSPKDPSRGRRHGTTQVRSLPSRWQVHVARRLGTQHPRK
ncbi:MAG: hypothetical protein QM767_25920 [Anaeromyxobacter sp.]